MELRCYPETSEFLHPKTYNLSDAYRSWLHFSFAARLLIFLAGAAGLFVSFRPGIHSARGIFYFVLLPSFTGIAAICGCLCRSFFGFIHLQWIRAPFTTSCQFRGWYACDDRFPRNCSLGGWRRSLETVPRVHSPSRGLFALLGIIVPTAIEQVPNFVAYVSARVHWASFEFARLAPPLFSSYFDFPNPMLLWNLPGAFFEEIIWRGYLQPRFIQRFGLMRGIRLLGTSWGASHFMGDFARVGTDTAVFTQVAFRLTSCIAMSYALAWLTLRSGSVWPAGLAHGFSNVWIFPLRYSVVGPQGGYLRSGIVRLCWALLGFMPFRYWPPSLDVEDSDPVADVAPA